MINGVGGRLLNEICSKVIVKSVRINGVETERFNINSSDAGMSFLHDI